MSETSISITSIIASVLEEVDEPDEFYCFVARYRTVCSEVKSNGEEYLMTRHHSTEELIGAVVYKSPINKQFFINRSAVSLTIEQEENKR